ncbi:MAG: PepSY domain-containing protein [Myxococcales bacterium]|nr:MAG: PepSY domain-containing protein [Myxococcales bacterium]
MSAPHRPRTPGSSGLFRAFWRWHFYASFLVVPILLVLATTGLIYLFRFQLEPLLHPDLLRAEAPSAQAIQQPYAAQQKTVEVAHPEATIVSMTEPGAADETTRFSITTADGAARDVFVDPWTADVLGTLNPDTTLSGYAVRLHGELMAGTYGEYVIELGACWALVMALSGYYLFVKGRKARKRAPKLRQRHALVGAFVGAGLLFLLVSGLPWTALWGAKAQELATSQGTSFWSEDHGGVSEPTSRLDESLPHSHRTSDASPCT